MNVRQILIGDIYWLKGEEEIPHPRVIININENNITVCSLTTNQKKVDMPGNVILVPGEGNLDRPSIVEVSKVLTIDKSQLGEYIGTLSEERVKQILNGIGFLERSFFSN